jgi:hypothetical protein
MLQTIISQITLTRVITVATSIVTLASAICALTPTPAPNTKLGKLYHFIEILALTIGKAKQSGITANTITVAGVGAIIDEVKGATLVTTTTGAEGVNVTTICGTQK